MRVSAWIVVGVVLGFLLGGIGPRRGAAELKGELDQLREENARLEARAGRGGRGGLMPGFDQLMPPRERPAEPAPDEAGDEGAAGDEPSGGEVTAVPAGPPPRPPTVAEQMQGFDLAVDAQNLRRQQSRQALREQADLSGEEVREVDEILADMNEQLATHGEEIMEILATGEEPSPKEMLSITHDVTGILAEAQESLDGVVGADRLEEVDEEAGVVWNHIDLGAFREAMEKAAELEAAGGGAAELPE